MNMLLALDFSNHSNEVIGFIQSLKLVPRMKLYLLHVIKPSQLPFPSQLNNTPNLEGDLSRIRADLRAHAYESLRQLQDEFENQHIKAYPLIVEGIPGEEIVKAIEKHRIDIVAMGNQGLSNTQRFFLGSVSEYVLTTSSCSVLIVRNPFAGNDSVHRRKMNVLLAIDGSPYSSTALAQLADFPLPDSSPVSLIHVTDLEEDFGVTSWSQSNGRNREVPEDLLNLITHQNNIGNLILREGEHRLSKAGKSTQTILASGHIASTILDAAEHQLTDLVVVGSRGLSGIKRYMLGSVSQKLVRHAPCSVLVIRKTSKMHDSMSSSEIWAKIFAEEKMKREKDKEVSEPLVAS